MGAYPRPKFFAVGGAPLLHCLDNREYALALGSQEILHFQGQNWVYTPVGVHQ